jgi:hypothetical protein
MSDLVSENESGYWKDMPMLDTVSVTSQQWYTFKKEQDCLLNTFAATLHMWSPSPPSVTRGRAMSYGQGGIQHGMQC